MLQEKTKVFVLENEAPSLDNPDVRPYRCMYCGELALIGRDVDAMDMPISASCDCVDATLETSLIEEIRVLGASLSEKQGTLMAHVDTKTFDSDTRVMRYEDQVVSLQKRFGIDQPV